MYKFDKLRFLTSAYNMKEEYSYENLRSKITFHYHSIEKGLSNANFRAGFGKYAFKELFFAMDLFLKNIFQKMTAGFNMQSQL
ncbi:hypothetical protein [Facklamia sp. P13055]|uniref:hypothetical protein n=1 Tax=Facklamia sp. P13055 TaxID=3421952 RepID=UPI003D17A073